jgi:Tfp pilus assembly protein PilO
MSLSGEDAMNKLSKEKRNQLVLVLVIFVTLVGGWYAVIYKSQTQNLATLRAKRDAARQKLLQVKQAVDSADQIEAQLAEGRKQLDKIEEGMAAGDLYSWAINTIREFKLAHKVEIPQFSQIDGPKDMTMLAGFPYKQATLTIGGSAQFHDFGKFISDFENQFPYIRVMNLSLEPASSLVSSEKERLAFRMEIAALVKPGA